MLIEYSINYVVRDKIYTRSIELIKNNCEDEDNCSLSDHILDRFCFDFLPQIHNIIEQFILESFSMERILYAGNYPQLCQLILVNFTQELAIRVLADESQFARIFKNQITHLVVLIDYIESRSYDDLRINVFQRIFSLLTTLTDLDFGQCSRSLHPVLTFNNSSADGCFSSTIVNLRINVRTFDDCQCLLDGRLSQLRTFMVRIDFISNSKLSVNNTDILHLECFSLTSYNQTLDYESHVVPLLRRMRYLQQLTLYVIVTIRSTFIDGIHLSNEILDHIPQLQTFNFNIITYADANNQLSISKWKGSISHLLTSTQENHFDSRILSDSDKGQKINIPNIICVSVKPTKFYGNPGHGPTAGSLVSNSMSDFNGIQLYRITLAL
ncbi:unnamed protein product [Rotaria magnacalcarata]|uniref:Uncharacterized protein n=1 Tax=Rotaria magnacalcarata TaxID=392030 RepID=A0A816TWH7_9BILA|nr:unnamed protein product [Rotaria magnacalcarata]